MTFCDTEGFEFFGGLSFHDIPWVPEVSRGPLRELPAQGRPMSASADGSQ